MSPEAQRLLTVLKRPISKTVKPPALDAELITYIEKAEAEIASLQRKLKRGKESK